MATSPVVQLANTSLDVSGLSTATTIPTALDPRAGTIYTPDTLAGAQPVWFHPFKDGSHLMCVSRIWSGAAPVGGTPGVYSTFIEATTPSWFVVNGLSGTVAVPAGGSTIPMTTPVTSSTLVGGASRPQDLMFLLHSVQINSTRQALLQHFDIKALNNSLTLGAEEVLPSTATVVFDKGIQMSTPFLFLYGTDADGKVYRIRKAWNKVGVNTTKAADMRGQYPQPGSVWEYYTGTGWSADPSELAPIQSDFYSDGPLSFGAWQSQVYVSTVVRNSTNYSARIWVSNKGRPFRQLVLPTPIALGSTADGTYCGAGLSFQSQLGANPTALSTGDSAGIVYVSTTKVLPSGHNSLVNSWGVWPASL
jgi:hypothetical protein